MTFTTTLIHLYRLLCMAILTGLSLASFMFDAGALISLVVMPMLLLALSFLFVLADGVLETKAMARRTRLIDETSSQASPAYFDSTKAPISGLRNISESHDTNKAA